MDTSVAEESKRQPVCSWTLRSCRYVARFVAATMSSIHMAENATRPNFLDMSTCVPHMSVARHEKLRARRTEQQPAADSRNLQLAMLGRLRGLRRRRDQRQVIGVSVLPQNGQGRCCEAATALFTLVSYPFLHLLQSRPRSGRVVQFFSDFFMFLSTLCRAVVIRCC